MSDARYAHLLQLVMFESNEGFPNYLVLYHLDVSIACSLSITPHAPRKSLQYCDSPRLETKSAHSSVVHSVMMVRGELLSASKFPKVVGVCSADGGSESVGEVSESVGR